MEENIKKIIITAGVIIIKNNKILLVKRPTDTKAFPNTWTFPGGKLENGESLVECAERECKEEAGLIPKNLVKHSFYEYDGGKYLTVSHLFKGDIEQEIQASDNIGLFSLSDLDNIKIAFDYKDFIKEELQKN